MNDEELYKQAMQDIKNLVEEVKERCKEFADEYYYNKEWVFDRFREELNKSIRCDK